MCVVQPRSFATALNIQPLKNVPSWSKNSSTSLKKKKKFHHTESTTNHTSLISQTQQSSKPIFTQSKKFSTPVVVYSQHRGESRSFALTHAQGGELSLSLSSLQAVNYSGEARGRFVTRSREDIVKFLPFSGTIFPFFLSFFAFLFFPLVQFDPRQWDKEKEGKRRTDAVPFDPASLSTRNNHKWRWSLEPRRVSYYVQLAREERRLRAVQGLAAV